ncbi:MAG: protein kinase domain-containing protein, partial [Planctomycetia bacterium]
LTWVGRLLGRYRLEQLLGKGGMGVVYRAVDVETGVSVAIKLLYPKLLLVDSARKRFAKEAVMLSRVDNPYVTRMLGFHETAGVHYLVVEFVDGVSLRALLHQRRRLSQIVALNIVADVCRALVDAHRKGMVHRDLKPDNILLPNVHLDDDPESWTSPPRAKLTDFGLAREENQSQTMALTQGTVLGTPYYMAPEQCDGSNVDARSDVYALGATLFELLAGRPPFDGKDAMTVMYKHFTEEPPAIERFRPDASADVSKLIRRLLAKKPDDRLPDAEALLDEIERLLRGDVVVGVLHPRLPDEDPRGVLKYDFRWPLASSPAALWPLVSDTERLNRAIGLPAVKYTNRSDEEGVVHRMAEAKTSALTLRWEEHPFEWIEGRQLGVLRRFESGPWQWFVSKVELAPRPEGGTEVRHSIRVKPHGLFGRLAANVEIGWRAQASLGKAYQGFDKVLQTERSPFDDAYADVPKLTTAQRRRLRQGKERLASRGVDAKSVDLLCRFLAEASDQDVGRIRPLALAERLKADPGPMTSACLHAARLGLLTLLWDILCPLCRIPSQVKDDLRTLGSHGECEACDSDFELDFARSVEMIFRAGPEVRDVETRTFCAGGPGHSPHVAAQMRVAPDERREIDLALPSATYLLRCPQMGLAKQFRVVAGASAKRWAVTLGDSSLGADDGRPGDGEAPVMAPGAQALTVRNASKHERLVKIERTSPRSDAVTAAMAAALPVFRELFPDQVFSAGQSAVAPDMTFVVVDGEAGAPLFRRYGEEAGFQRVKEQLTVLTACVEREGGVVLKVIGAGMFAVMNDPLGGVRTACAMAAATAERLDADVLPLRIGVHRGGAVVANLGEKMDYFGTTVAAAARIAQAAGPDEVWFSDAVLAHPGAYRWLTSRSTPLAIVTDPIDAPGVAVLQRCSFKKV